MHVGGNDSVRERRRVRGHAAILARVARGRLHAAPAAGGD
jgi:hypothetical protein